MVARELTKHCFHRILRCLCIFAVDAQLPNRCLASTYKYQATRVSLHHTSTPGSASLRCGGLFLYGVFSCCLRLYKTLRVSLHHTSTYAEMTLYKSAQNYFAAHLLHGCARAHQVLLPSSPALPLQSSGSDVQLLNRCLASTCKYYDKGLHSEASNDILRGRSTHVPRHHCIRFCGCDALLLAAHQRYTTARCRCAHTEWCVFRLAPMSHGGDCLSARSLLFIYLIFMLSVAQHFCIHCLFRMGGSDLSCAMPCYAGINLHTAFRYGYVCYFLVV